MKADGEVDSHNSAMIEVKERLASLSITLKVGTHLGGSGIGFWKEVDEMEKVLATERKKD